MANIKGCLFRRGNSRAYAAAFIFLCAATANATPCDTNTNPILDTCFTVHGRLQAYNGNPSFRIWVIGTNRLLGVNETGAAQDIFPPNLRAIFPTATAEQNLAVAGEFKVCPLSQNQKGSMRSVCIQSANKLVPNQR